MIDVHCHLLPCGHGELAARFGMALGGAQRPPELEDPDACCNRLGERGLAVVSPPPWLFRLDLERRRAASFAAELNDGMLAATADEPRAAVLGWLPLQSVEAAVAEARRIARERRVVGVEIGTDVPGGSLADSALDPLWDVLAGEELAVLVHPNADALEGRVRSVRPQVLGFPVATTAALLELLASDSGLWSSGVRLCASHGGGFLAPAIGRAAQDGMWDGDGTLESRLERVWVDGVVFDDRWLDFLEGFLPERHVLPGTDWPFRLSVPDERLRAQERRLEPDPLGAALAWCPRLARIAGDR